jgi:hypothetical protein
VALVPGRHRLGPADGSVTVSTRREGMAAKAGHDLVIDVNGWEAAAEVGEGTAGWAFTFEADPRSLRVREGLGGVKPLTDGDRADIHRTIEAKVLGTRPIAFRSTAVRPADDGTRIEAEGELTLAGRTLPIEATLAVAPDGRLTGSIPVTQSAWGIRPYRGLMGALKVRDEVEVVVDVRLPTA